MRLTVHNAAGESVLLSATPLAQGGEAAVHAVPEFPGVVVKLYHSQVLQKRRDALRAKIDAMTGDPRLSRFKQHPGLAWPCFAVFDEQGQWRGYAMRKAVGVRMSVLAHAMAYREHFPHLDREAVVVYLLSLLQTLQELHSVGVSVGDYNLANFLCDPVSNTVTLIDCDSWQIHTGGSTFFCPVAAPDMLAPELQGKHLDQISRTRESEYFSLAILLFKALMLGRHPYDVVGGAGPVENIRKGYFPYGVGGGGIPKGPWFNIWSHLSFKLKERLILTFKDGALDVSARTSIAEWIDVLKLYKRELSKGWHSNDIKPDAPKSKERQGT